MSDPIANIRCVLTDIEGTTTSISFVYDVLFPYFTQHMSKLLKMQDMPEVADAFAMIKAEQNLSTNAEVIKQLQTWVDADVKHTQLKRLQGVLWQQAYTSGEITGHVYSDVPEHLRQWHSAGIMLAVYSSGSVAAQKLLFGHSDAGDLCPLFSAYFDTRIGQKREQASYATISEELQLNPNDILFLSDVPAELEAAKTAGMQTVQLVRPGTAADSRFITAKTFKDINLAPVTGG